MDVNAVYDEGLITQSHAIQRAESQMASLSGSGNAWMYLLLGDPDLQIRRENPRNIRIEGLGEILECRPPCFIELQVFEEKINPIKEALVGFWKPGPMLPIQKKDEVFVNSYADKNGRVKVDISPQTSGTLYYAVEDGRGNAILGSVKVKLMEAN